MIHSREFSDSIVVRRLAVPSPGGAIFFVVFSLFVVVFASVATYNLVHWKVLTALEIGGSILWLLLVTVWVVGPIVEEGGLLVALAKIFARVALIEIISNGTKSLRYGFEWVGKGFYYPPIEINRIGMVSWILGQESNRTGRDCNDWNVALWFDRDDSRGTWDSRNLKGKEIRVITPDLPKKDADAVGRSVVECLQGAGLQFILTDEDKAYGGWYIMREWPEQAG